MGKMFVLDKTGHTTHKWDHNVQAEVEAARATYDALTGRGYRAFRSEDGETKGRMERFDPNAEEVTFVPHLQGG